MGHTGNALPGGFQQNGRADVAAGAEHHVGGKLPQEPAGTAAGGHQQTDALAVVADVAPGEAALDAQKAVAQSHIGADGAVFHDLKRRRLRLRENAQIGHGDFHFARGNLGIDRRAQADNSLRHQQWSQCPAWRSNWIPRTCLGHY